MRTTRPPRSTPPRSRQSIAPQPVPGGAVDRAGLTELGETFQARLAQLWAAASEATLEPGKLLPEIVAVPPGDRRFRSPAWRSSPFHAFVLQQYLIYADYLRGLAQAAQVPPDAANRLRFLTEQFIDAIAPSNFPATNPEVVELALRTDGASLLRGAANLADDLRRGRISQSAPDAFAVGRNVAVTPGSVVFRNELCEVIQYQASTAKVHERPLVIVPPCINKYYVLDLRPENSFARHVVAAGHTTFMVSWRNIPPGLGALTWEDYLQRGVLEALAVAREVSGARKVNALGFCVGGTLLACALAVLAARNDDSVASLTLLNTMLDFEDPGEIGVYVTRPFLAMREPALEAGGRIHGSELAGAFSTLRANDLVWNYVVGNYLKGETPPAFDLLHWNADSANLPGPMYAYYLRECYLNNRLRQPGALTMLDEPVDLGRIEMPAYVFAAEEDHIVPWRSAYRSRGLLGGPSEFVLGSSGHIAGVINPPTPPKRSYRHDGGKAADPQHWYEQASATSGSWWPHWDAWLAKHAGRLRSAPAGAGSRTHPPIDSAPGRYVVEPAK